MSKSTIRELYDHEVEKYKMFADCGYTEYRDKTPMLPAHTMPGLYPVFYLDGNNHVLCSSCATDCLVDKNDEWGDECKPVAWDIYYEGEDMYCEECNAVIESAYGDPESERTE